MHPARSPGLAVSLAVASGLAVLGQFGCAAATPPATSPPSGAEVEVVVPKADAPARAKGEEGTMGELDAKSSTDAHIARQAALRDAAEFGLEGLLDSAAVTGSGVSMGVLGGGTPVTGGVIGGVGSGFGGLGLSGVGIGGGSGGGGIGLGSIGTLGHGSGAGISFGGGGYRSDPMPGTSIDVGGRSVIELGDSTTLGLSLEQAVRALRDQSRKLRSCYETKGLDVSAKVEGSMPLRLVIGSDGRVVYAASVAPFLPSKQVVTCVTEALTKIYVGPPLAGSFGVIETVVSFRPAPRK